MKKSNPIRIFLGIALFFGLPLGIILPFILSLFLKNTYLDNFVAGMVIGFLPGTVFGLYVAYHARQITSFSFKFDSKSKLIEDLSAFLKKDNIVLVHQEENKITYKYWNFLFEVPIYVEFTENSAKITAPSSTLKKIQSELELSP